MSCACRRSQTKDSRKRRKSRPPDLNHAGRPNTSTNIGAIFLQEQRDILIKLQSKVNISNLVGGPRSYKDQAKDPQASPQIIERGNHPSQRHYGALICNVGKTEGQQAPGPGRPASPGPPGLRINHPRKPPKVPTSRSN